MGDHDPHRKLTVPEVAADLRLDKFLARWFPTMSRSVIVRGIRAGLVSNGPGAALRPASIVKAGQQLWIRIPGIAPDTPPPPLPPILYEDDRLVVLDKPAGLLCHPSGTAFQWAVIGLARQRWPDVDLVHRLDRDTSGVLVLSLDAEANRALKATYKRGEAHKEYLAICRQAPAWDRQVLDGPIGAADGPIRIQMAVRPDGLVARTEVEVLERDDRGRALVRCRIETGRTHQIRVHLAESGASIVGDRMYGVAPEVFLNAWEHGVDDRVIEDAGAPRHALHARRIVVPHPDGGAVDVTAAIPDDMRRWWARPHVLPFDRT